MLSLPSSHNSLQIWQYTNVYIQNHSGSAVGYIWHVGGSSESGEGLHTQWDMKGGERMYSICLNPPLVDFSNHSALITAVGLWFWTQRLAHLTSKIT